MLAKFQEMPLLLARGACIETPVRFTSWNAAKLLLARGACIETHSSTGLRRRRMSCSSQEEHVLKLSVCVVPDGDEGCSSQEEHVLKQKISHFFVQSVCCSSQEEHVLKRCTMTYNNGTCKLLLARGACIETSLYTANSRGVSVAPRKRSMY